MNKKNIITLLTFALLIGSLFGSGSVNDAELHLEVRVKEMFLHGFIEGQFDILPSGEGEYLLEFADAEYWNDLEENEDFSRSRSSTVSLEGGLENYSDVATYHLATNTPTNFSINFAISHFTATGGFSIPWTLVVNSATLDNLTLNGTTPLNLASGSTHSGILTRPQLSPSIGYLFLDVNFNEDDTSLTTAGSYTATVTATVITN